MFVSTSLGSTPIRPQQRKFVEGSVASEAMDRLVPGDFPQTEQDLAAFSQPVLDLLSRYGVRVAVLAPGQTLADTAGLRTLSQDENRQESQKANSIISSSISEAFPNGPESMVQLETEADLMTRKLRTNGLEHQLGIALSPFSLDELAEARSIPDNSREDWKASFSDLNQGLVVETADGLQTQQGLLVLPHTYRDGEAVPEVRLRNARQLTAEYVEGSLGLNRSDERMVLLHENFLSLPAPELGNYRLATHEVGHALDYALENLSDDSGFGIRHRETIDQLYAQDQAKLKALGAEAKTEDVFTSDRADDDVREYFAEAVEAYLTPQKNDLHETFRAGNSKEGLASKNPALFAYVDKIMTSDFPETAVPKAPQRQFAPPGFPDPDLEVVRVS